jgi:hypothetical protein
MGRSCEIRTYDFENLYTTIPHDKVVYRVNRVIDNNFGDFNYIHVSRYGSRYSNDTDVSGTYDHSFTRDGLKKAIKWLVNNAYFTAGGNIFRQKEGLPMGMDASPDLANLYLFHQEFDYFRKHWSALRNYNPELTNFFRLIDDITVINDKGMFEEVFKEIYDSELSLKRINSSSSRADVLDLAVTFNGGRNRVALFDKRRDFNFEVIRYPHLNSCTAFNSKINVVFSQTLRIMRICNNKEDIIKEIECLVLSFLGRGYDLDLITRRVIKCFNKHQRDFQPHFQSPQELRLAISELKH